MRAATRAPSCESETERPAPHLAQPKSETIRPGSQINFRGNWKAGIILWIKVRVSRIGDCWSYISTARGKSNGRKVNLFDCRIGYAELAMMARETRLARVCTKIKIGQTCRCTAIESPLFC